TFNNTWFIGLQDDGGFEIDSWWERIADTTNGDDSLCYDGSTLIDLGGGIGLDFLTKVGLGLDSTTVNSTDINLCINSTQFTDNSTESGSGWWNSTQRYHGNNNELNFSVSADWFNFEFNITDIQVNYTKTYTANTTYTVENGSDVYWESEANFTAFDHRLNNNSLNFTIPSSWNTLSLTNYSTPVTIDNTFLDGSSKLISVFDTKAIDGNWTLYCNSSNLGSGLQTLKSGLNTDVAYYQDVITPNATFSESISGDVFLEVFYPNGTTVYGSEKKTVSGVNSVAFNVWDLSTNVGSTYGLYTLQSWWNNTEGKASLDEKNLYIFANTSYDITSPENNSASKLYVTNEIFNITVYYEDLQDNTPSNGNPINDATIHYWIGASEYTINGGGVDGKYNISITVNSSFSEGENTIKITCNKTYYQNHTIYFVFTRNTIPTFSEISILEPAYTDTNLNATATGWSDPDSGQSPDYTYSWFLNDTKIDGQTGDSLTSDNFLKHDEIIVEATPFDGLEYGTPINSTFITIINSRPIWGTTDVEITPLSPNVTIFLTATVSEDHSDPDGDPTDFYYEWIVEGTTVQWNTTNTLNHGFSKGDTV
ncbi:MAG: hypothetical protein ACTSQB_07575, partial [Candidatus Heimdallarchaeota archaeon]